MIYKKYQLKKIKKNNNKKIKDKVGIKIKLNQVLNDIIEKKFKIKYIVIRILRMEINIINK